MELGAILNSDVGSVRASASRALHWWLGQLEELLPASRRRRSRGPRQLVVWDGSSLSFVTKRGVTDRMPRANARVTLAVPATFAFKRTLQLPRLGSADLRQLVELEAERLSPLPASESLVGMQILGPGEAAGTVSVGAAVLPQLVAEQALAAAGDVGLAVTSVGLLSGNERTAQFDFMPALRRRGLVPIVRSPAAIWWLIVAFAIALNVAVLVIRDQQSVDRLSAVVDEQAPAVTAARAIQQRADDFDSSAQNVAAQRRSHDVLGALGIVSQDLPVGAWVQRFSYSGGTARLTGYRRKDVDVPAALRRDPRIAQVRMNSAQLVTDTPVGQPFDLSVRFRGGL